MWWEPKTEDEVRVKNEVKRLSNRLTEREYPADLVYGVGSINWRGRVAPLLIVDGHFDPRRRSNGGVGGRFSGMLYDLVGPLWPLSYRFEPDYQQDGRTISSLDLLVRFATRVFMPDTPRPLEWMFGTAEDAGSDFLSEFRSWSLPTDLVVLFGRPPKALTAIGVAPLMRETFGTVGLVGTVNGKSPGYTTAGHVVGGLGVLVSRARRVLGRILRIGEQENVVLYADPLGGPAGYDMAVVSSENVGHAMTFETRGKMIIDPRAVNKFDVCHLDGAMSGGRWGFVHAGLDKSKDDKGRQWASCWTVTGQAGWFCKEGDSGSVVKLEDGTILGVLVGGLRSGGWLWSSRMEIGFVQDLHSAIEFVRTTHNCDFRLS
jgi:hypothetical protein